MKTSRILVIALVLVVAVASVGVAQPKWSSYYLPGNVAFGVDAALGRPAGSWAFELYPAAELLFSKVRVLDIVPIDFGAGVRGAVSFGPSFIVGADVFGSAHVGFRGISTFLSDVLGNVDIRARLGLGYQFSPDADARALRLISDNAVSYFLSEHLAVSLMYGFTSPLFSTTASGWSSTGIGVVVKLGDAEPLYQEESWLDDVTAEMDIAIGNMAVIQFSSMYWAFFGMGGFIVSDAGYEVGQGTRWRTTITDDGETSEMILERALLHEAADGSRWWRVAFEVDGERLAYEFLVDESFGLLELRYEDEAGNLARYEAGPDDQWWVASNYQTLTADDFSDMSVGSERVSVAAGTFQAERLEYAEPDGELVWWVSDDAPGLLVRFDGRGDDYESISGELIQVISGVTSPWGAAW